MGMKAPTLATPGRIRAVGVAVLAVLAVAAFDAVRLWRAAQWNALITSGAPPAAAAVTASQPAAPLPVQVQFAQAYAQAASGAEEAALNHYRALQEDATVGDAARYNSANLLLRQAARLQDTPQAGQAIPLVELAKEGLREVLRRHPGDWNARYNLERAQRLLPDPEEADLDPPDLARNAERAATTMRGFSPGLP